MKFCIVAFFIGVAASVAALPTSHAEEVRIQISPQTATSEIADDFIGFGYETSAMALEGFFSEDNTHMVQLYRTLGTSGLARIGGIIGDHTRFEPDGTPVPHDKNDTTVINRKVIDDFGGFLRATGWKAMWTLNLGTGTKEEATEEAIAVQASLGDRLHSFEIGNEVDLLKRFDDYASYHQAYVEYKAAVRAALPSAVFSGADVATKVDWSENFARDEASDMSLLIHHYYRGGQKSQHAKLETLLGPHREWDEKLARLRGACTENNLVFRINEVNSFSGGGREGLSDTFASAIWCLDYMFHVAEYGGVGVNMQTDLNQLGFISHYSPIFREEDGSLTARPDYYGMLAFSLAGKGSLVKVKTSKHLLNLNAYATLHPDGTMWVSVINKDLQNDANIQLTLLSGYESGDAFRLVAPSVLSKTNVTLAGSEVADNGTWSARETEKLSVTGNRAVIAVPATSAVMLRLNFSGEGGLPVAKAKLANGWDEVIPNAATAPAVWRWTTSQPADDWTQPAFQDSTWSEGTSAFGTSKTPGTSGKLNTNWDTKDIWIRRTVKLPNELGDNLHLLVHHDNAAEVYIDGILAWRSQHIETRDYTVFEISPEAQECLEPGATITIAAHGNNHIGGQVLDVGLIHVK